MNSRWIRKEWRVIVPRCAAVALSAAVATAAHLVPRCYAAPPILQTKQTASATGASRHIGAIKTINGTAITLTPDSGPDINITIQPTTRIVRIAPGEKDLKNASPIQLQDLQIGDRILVGGKASDDNSSVMASTVVVITHSDLEAHHEQELQDWQKRGVDGTVTAVDASAATVTITARAKPLVVQTSKATVIRRYAPDSVKFDDAKPGTLSEIHPGDQVRARGDRSADGTALTADEIVSGTFHNIAGTVNAVDASSSTLSVHDLLSNKTVTVKVTADSQLHQLPPDMAQRLAARLKRTAAGSGSSGAPGSGSSALSQNDRPAGAQGTTGLSAGGASNGPGGAPDLQRMLSRLPTVSLNDLHKGDAVIVLSTEGSAGVGTTITLLTGVEPILQAAPNASGASILTPWSLGAPSGDAGGP
jgi:Domain of unknown function (DUF5666)